jgi:single-stranded-DNA-specific exonuclease
LDSALSALRLLLSQDIDEAGRLAQELDGQNRKRQEQTLQMQMQAEEIIHSKEDGQYLLFASAPEFNPGLVGLVASRLTEQYYRPAVVASISEEFTRASCRSIPEFHITQALDQCQELLEHHGGHAAAAGFTVSNNNLPELIDRLQQIAREQLASLDLQPSLRADMEIPLHQLHPKLLGHLENFQPTGQGNPAAVFVSRGLRVVRARGVGKDSAHLKLTLSDERITYDGIAFRQGKWLENMPPRLDILYTFEMNEFNGQKNLQLNIQDIKPSAS